MTKKFLNAKFDCIKVLPTDTSNREEFDDCPLWIVLEYMLDTFWIQSFDEPSVAAAYIKYVLNLIFSSRIWTWNILVIRWPCYPMQLWSFYVSIAIGSQSFNGKNQVWHLQQYT